MRRETATPQQVLQKLDDIEAEMKRIGYWDDTLDEGATRNQAIAYAYENSKSPVGSMNFENWLQAVFLPNAREAARSKSLPKSSSVAVLAMREYDYHSHVPETQALLELLREFDGLFALR